jgi:hypothetical protein
MGTPALQPGGGSGVAILMHSVFFTLKDGSAAAREALLEGCRKHLTGHPGELFFSCGTLRDDHVRDVNQRDFDVSLNIAFARKADHDAYQDHPRHHEFVRLFSSNWVRARVFDSDAEVIPPR